MCDSRREEGICESRREEGTCESRREEGMYESRWEGIYESRRWSSPASKSFSFSLLSSSSDDDGEGSLLLRRKVGTRDLTGTTRRVAMNNVAFTKPDNMNNVAAKMVTSKGTRPPLISTNREQAIGRIRIV